MSLKESWYHTRVLDRVHISCVQVSPGCTKLLRKMLTVDPDRRITADEVFNHTWTQTDMPEDLRTVNSRLLVRHASGSCCQLRADVPFHSRLSSFMTHRAFGPARRHAQLCRGHVHYA